MKRRCRAGVLVAIALATLGGCISDAQEEEIGDTVAAEVNPQLPMIDDPAVDAYLYALGDRLAAVSSRPDLDYRFYVIDSDVVNAFSLPGGYIYVTRGLVERTHNEGELAAVLAHEIGHVAARHGIQKLERQLRTGSLVNFLYNLILGGEPGLLRTNSVQLASAVWSARHSRGDEEEADRLAVDYMLRSGIRPEAMITLFESLLAEEQQVAQTRGLLEIWFSTHPLTRDRIENVRIDIEELNDDRAATQPLHPDAFAAFKARVTRGIPLTRSTS